jgi:hypothetical protein
MLIKSQNNKWLLDTAGICLEITPNTSYQIVAYSLASDNETFILLGAYESMARAIEVLDEIAKFDGYVFYMPQE